MDRLAGMMHVDSRAGMMPQQSDQADTLTRLLECQTKLLSELSDQVATAISFANAIRGGNPPVPEDPNACNNSSLIGRAQDNVDTTVDIIALARQLLNLLSAL